MTNLAETILNVEGMTCASCVRHVEGALRELGGIGVIEVRLREGTVRVQHDPARTPIDALVGALEGAGYGSRAGT